MACLGHTESYDWGEDIGSDREGRWCSYKVVVMFYSFLILFWCCFSFFSMIFAYFCWLFLLLYSCGHSLFIYAICMAGLWADVVTQHKGHFDWFLEWQVPLPQFTVSKCESSCLWVSSITVCAPPLPSPLKIKVSGNLRKIRVKTLDHIRKVSHRVILGLNRS